MAPVAAPQRVTHLTLHHQGEFWLEGKPVPQYLQQLQRWSREVKRWSDIPYHYVVAPDGTVYAARDDAVAGDTNTEYDPQGHILVMLLGNFEVQTPTSAQWGGTVKLLAQLARRHGLDPAALATHRDYSAQTVCPGENLYRKFGDLRLQVAQQLNGAP